MRRQDKSSRGRKREARAREGLAAVWADLIRPGLLIAFVGLSAVMYISACARVSIMEWDLHQLQERADVCREDCVRVQRQIAEERKSSDIRDHATEHGLAREAAIAEVTVDSVPRELLPDPAASAVGVEAELAEITSTPAGGTTRVAAVPPAR